MLQLYIVYRLLLYRRHWGWTVGIDGPSASSSSSSLGFDNPESEVMNRYRYNFMGGMLPFGLGILYARYGETDSDDVPLAYHQLLWLHLLHLADLQSERQHGWPDLRAFLLLCLLKRIGSRPTPKHQLVIRYLQGIRVDGQHLRRPLRMPPYHPQDIHS